MVVKRIPCDFSQSMYVSQGTYKSNDIVGRKRQIGTKLFSPAEVDTLTDFDAVFKVAHKKTLLHNFAQASCGSKALIFGGLASYEFIFQSTKI